MAHALFWGAFSLSSWREGEPRAARIALLVAVLGLAGGLAVGLLPAPIPQIGVAVLAAGVVGLLGLWFWPVGRLQPDEDQPRQRYDERDIIFARARLRPGSAHYEQYYAMRPQYKAGDDKARNRPGLLSPRARYANPIAFAAADASFFLTESLRDAVDGPVAPERQLIPPAEASHIVKDLARFYGALDVGITRLHPNHVYSHIGRGSGVYGAPITLPHDYAIAITVEMDHTMVGSAPTAPVVMESAREYGAAARVAVPLAAFLRNLGYQARAHIDGNYRVIAPLVARDAGLGEIGRMGILITPRHGPRVRLAVVTTTMPLQPDERRPRTSVIDFCTICQKCTRNCPSRAIPDGPRSNADGVLRWRLDAETCYAYWTVAGSDCARCMTVCPYSHPQGLFHDLVRWGIERSGGFRRAALWLDDIFYGQRPARRPVHWNRWDQHNKKSGRHK